MYSSAALVLNVFAYWHARNATTLLEALELDPEPDVRLSFEEPLPTGLVGDPPTADVALCAPSGRMVAIESKLGEWLVRRPRGRVFKDKYFPPHARVWTDAGLPRCQALAEALQRSEERYRWLNGAQLLKHALGLARIGATSWTLMYLYYEQEGREATAHRVELERLRAALGTEIELRVRTYQQVYAALSGLPDVDASYLGYLRERYFS